MVGNLPPSSPMQSEMVAPAAAASLKRKGCAPKCTTHSPTGVRKVSMGSTLADNGAT